MNVILPLILDGLVLLLLAGTIFYAARLSLHIKAFRDSRRDMEGLLADLSAHIERADLAIRGLRESAREAGRDLQEQIGEAKALSEELQIMSDSGNRLAGRLEKLADRGSVGMVPDPVAAGPGTRPRPAESKSPAKQKSKAAPFGFAIRDPEFERADEGGDVNEQGLFPGEDSAVDEDVFVSRAERELYEALQKKSRKADAGGVS